MNKSYTIGILFALAVGMVGGYVGAGYQYSAQMNKIKAAFPTQPTMSFVSGTIQSISGSVITIQTPSAMNPFEDLPTVRKVTVTSKTVIVKTTSKDPAVFQQEIADFQKAMQKNLPGSGTSTASVATKLPTPPMPSTETEVKIADLKVGDMISVDAGKDVKTQTSFEAVKITVTGVGAGMPLPLSPGATGAAPVVNTPPPPPTTTR